MNKTPIIRLDSVDSTLDYATEKLDPALNQEFTVVWTSHQTAGKGQSGNSWESEAGKNICYSILFMPHFLHPSQQFMLTKVISLAALEVLSGYLPPSLCKIKWPNDIYVGTHKMAGILVYNKIKGVLYERAVAGIGLNINQSLFSPDIPNPTSFQMQTGKEYPLEPIVQQLTSSMKKYYALLQNQKTTELDQLYLDHLLFLNELRYYEYKGMQIKARIKDVNEYGLLLLQKENDEVLECDLKELRYVFSHSQQ